MTAHTRLRLLSIAALAALLLAPSPAAAADEALALVPPDVASVGLIRLDQLRASPFASRIFEDTDRLTSDGDAARFLEEAGLDPRRDVDVIVVAAVPGRGPEERVLVLFEGRFDPSRLSAAVVNRGASVRVADGTEYYLIKSKRGDEGGDESGHDRGAVAFVSRRLVIAGDETSVLRALADRRRGGSALLSGEGLGANLSRIERGASAWALVDARRFPVGRWRHSGEGKGSGDPTSALVGVMKSVTLYVLQATAHADTLEVSATGLTADRETRELLEDALRGVVAMWRIAVSEKRPELVPIIRRFTVRSDEDGVTVSGTLPATFLRALSERRQARRGD